MMFIISEFMVNLLTFSNRFIGITIFPFVFVRDKKFMNRDKFVIHESIHLKQQMEMLIIFFYLFYFIEFIFRYYQYNKDKKLAYRNISFEREAKTNQLNKNYLKTRKFYSWINYLKIK